MAKIVKSEAEWKNQLSDLAYKVTRKHGTERPFTNDSFPKTDAAFTCTCCDAPVFSGSHKFDSGTGWPSFYKPIDADALDERADNGFFMRRTEVVCANCDAHLGHVFPDGPQPTGLRYCINGVALKLDEQD